MDDSVSCSPVSTGSRLSWASGGRAVASASPRSASHRSADRILPLTRLVSYLYHAIPHYAEPSQIMAAYCGSGGRMDVKFIARNTGSSRAAAYYLLGERDPAGQPRAGVEVLRSGQEQVATVADALEFRAQEEVGRVRVVLRGPAGRRAGRSGPLQFEKTAWAGLDADRYSWTAVLTASRAAGTRARALTSRRWRRC